MIETKDILAKNKEFKKYILQNGEIADILSYISKKRKSVYIFSGVIKDFFLGRKIENIRDIDIVISGSSVPKDLIGEAPVLCGNTLFNNGAIKFTTYSLLRIDVWNLKNDFGLNNMGLEAKPESLLKTCLYNFQQIVYDWKNEKFIVGNGFIDFLNNKVIDVVNKEHPWREFVIINTMKYKEELGYSIGESLKKLVKKYYIENLNDFYTAQIHIFGHEQYGNDAIEDFCLL